MEPLPASTDAWALTAIEQLRRNGSWTGRIHVHKHLFITQVLKLANVPFEFQLYDYGPYSFELDERFVDLELSGHVARSYPQPDYGPSYSLTSTGTELAHRLSSQTVSELSRVAAKLGKRKSQDLELIATCLWVIYRESIEDDNLILAKVQAIKPKFSLEEIRAGLEESRKLTRELAA